MDTVTLADVKAAIGDGHDAVEQAVEQFMNQNYDMATFDVTLGGVHVEFYAPDDPDGEPVLDAFFDYYTGDDHPDAPFMTRAAHGVLLVEDDDGELYRNEDLTLNPTDDLYQEVRSRFVFQEGAESAAVDALKRYFRERPDE